MHPERIKVLEHITNGHDRYWTKQVNGMTSLKQIYSWQYGFLH